ncbi:hypothetical protein [Adhaeribacter aquaticus]|uniref:hypothetical protein n=1 Tax=Adhaeribacter aquaticus TaxID=299567 RepID=UPI0003F8690D|nr:hypothetical protein [Adhaeribacter aquaticus]
MNEDNSYVLKELIDVGSDIAGSTSGAMVGSFIAGPPGLVFGSMAGPLIKKVVCNLGIEISKRLISPREEKRIGAAYIFALEKMAIYQERGLTIRDDDFFNELEFDRSNAEEVLEGILLTCQRTFEEKKIQYIGYLYANIIYNSNINRNYANFLIKLSNELTFRQYCLIYLLKDFMIDAEIDYPEDKNHPDITIKRVDVISEVRDLITRGLYREYVFMADEEVDNTKPIFKKHLSITRLGNDYINYLQLNEIPFAYLIEIQNQFL